MGIDRACWCFDAEFTLQLRRTLQIFGDGQPEHKLRGYELTICDEHDVDAPDPPLKYLWVAKPSFALKVRAPPTLGFAITIGGLRRKISLRYRATFRCPQ